MKIEHGIIADNDEFNALSLSFSRALAIPALSAIFQEFGERVTTDCLVQMVVTAAESIQHDRHINNLPAFANESVSASEVTAPEVDRPQAHEHSFIGVLDAAFQLIREINSRVPGRSITHRPFMPDRSLLTILADRIASEVEELRAAGAHENEVALVDAFVDIVVITLDAMCITGHHPSIFFADVMRANFRKVFPDGLMHKDEDGKYIKPDGWVGPEVDIERHLASQKIYGYKNCAVGVPLVPFSAPRSRYVITGQKRERVQHFGLNPVETSPFVDELAFTHIEGAKLRFTSLMEIVNALTQPPFPPRIEVEALLRLNSLPGSILELGALKISHVYQWTDIITEVAHE